MKLKTGNHYAIQSSVMVCAPYAFVELKLLLLLSFGLFFFFVWSIELDFSDIPHQMLQIQFYRFRLFGS